MPLTGPSSLFRRASLRVAGLSLARVRRILLGLFVATAFLDAAGKALASHPAVSRAVSGLVTGRSAHEMQDAARPSGNFEIFRMASRHLVEQRDLYASYPDEVQDRFKYSPTFAMLFAPLAWLWWPLALFLWSTLNALVLFIAVERVLPRRAAMLAMGLMLLEVLRSMQNGQSNALVAGLIIISFAALERASAWRAAAAVALGASVKIFPLAALSFALPRRRAWRTGAWALAIGATLLVLPLTVTTAATLRAQYGWWRGVEASDALQRWFSVMELVHRWTGAELPNWSVQLAGTLVLLAPLALRRDRWEEPGFRLLYLCSLLLYVVLFNHQAERASYVIAFAGMCIWYASRRRSVWRTALFGLAFLAIPFMTTLVPGAVFRTPDATLYRLALPTLLIWLAIQCELLGSERPAREAPALG